LSKDDDHDDNDDDDDDDDDDRNNDLAEIYCLLVAPVQSMMLCFEPIFFTSTDSLNVQSELHKRLLEFNQTSTTKSK